MDKGCHKIREQLLTDDRPNGKSHYSVFKTKKIVFLTIQIL